MILWTPTSVNSGWKSIIFTIEAGLKNLKLATNLLDYLDAI